MAISELSAKVIFDDAIADTVDFGFSQIGDTLFTEVIITNTGDKVLKFGPIRPSLSIEETGGIGHENDHEEFHDNIGTTNRLISIAPGDTFKIEFSYIPDIDTSTYPYGMRVAKFTLGLYDSTDVPQDISKYIKYSEFIFVAWKLKLPIDGLVDYYDFDSVYINPTIPPRFKWEVANTSDEYLTIEKKEFTWLTPQIAPDEFEFEGIIPSELPPKSEIEWIINYKPHNIGLDRGILKLIYNYDNIDSSTTLEVRGFSVNQDLEIAESDSYNYSADTIDFGKVWVGLSTEIYAVLGNSGNCPFGIIGQNLFDGSEGELQAEGFDIINGLKENIHLLMDREDTVSIKFTADRRGKYIARYVIESDILSRNIKAVPADKIDKIIYLLAEGIEPQFSVENDTIDFGNVVWHPNCPTSRTITIKIRNIGNADLNIHNIEFNEPFIIEAIDNELPESIAAFAEDSVRIIFSPSNQDEYFSVIKFFTNQKQPQDTFLLYVKASRTDPSNINLSIPRDIVARPGRRISIPILIDKNVISDARTFKAELTFDRTLLKYNGYNKLNAAIENIDDNNIIISQDADAGRMDINIETSNLQSNFLSSDTLINLLFDTYLGEKISTPIAFVEPLFGNGSCEYVLIPIVQNGVFAIDSVCGLVYKLLPSGVEPFMIEDVSPNPASSEVKLNFVLKFKTFLEINLYNNFAYPVKNISKGYLMPGKQEIVFSCSELSNGVYYIEFRVGIFKKVMKLIVANR